ncbi:putative phage abortive infection protein [Sphingomonas changbaiensis]|nr:putative phage abortive infection protein [Sphingomonas changbaiensis]
MKWLPRGVLGFFSILAAVWCLGVVLQGLAAGHDLSFVETDFSLSGTFGDSFGGLSAFMATAAAIGAWEAVRYQREELANATKRETELDKVAAKRDFEVTFFHLQATLDRIVEQIDIGHLTWKRTGKDAFSSFADQVRKTKEKSDPDYGSAYQIVFLRNQNDLAHYFRTLFNIVFYVDGSEREDAYFYVKLIRATLSEPELILLALNGLFHEEGRANFKPLIEKYALLNNISAGAKADFDLEDHYEPIAFGSVGLEISPS